MAQRVTLRKRQPYNTKSNRRRVVKTPGGKLVYHHLKKRGTAPKCGDCGIALPGVRPRLSSTRLGWLAHTRPTLVSRSLLSAPANTPLSPSGKRL
jgi:ribosomal protein L34E